MDNIDDTGARRDSTPPLSELSTMKRLTWGGSMAIQLGTVTLLGASPKIGYRVTEKLTAGLGGTYYYRSEKVYGTTSKFYGASAYARHLIMPRIFVHAEAERIHRDDIELQSPAVDMLWIGAGYYTSITPRAAAGMVLLYDVLENPNRPYSNPDIRGGITFGF
jgi:hypothetical protein